MREKESGEREREVVSCLSVFNGGPWCRPQAPSLHN